MTKQHPAEKVLLKIPVQIEVRALTDGAHVSCNETTVDDVLYSAFVKELEEELQGDTRDLHDMQKFRIAAYVRRELLPKEAPDSPIYLPGTWVEVMITGNISTWDREPYNN